MAPLVRNAGVAIDENEGDFLIWNWISGSCRQLPLTCWSFSKSNPVHAFFVWGFVGVEEFEVVVVEEVHHCPADRD